MASSVYKAQEAVDVCNFHTNKKLTLFCKTCNKAVCTACVKIHHNDHDWDDIDAAMNERRACLPTVCRHILDKKLPSLKTLITTEDDDDNDETLQQLEKKRISINEATNTLIFEKKQKYRTFKGKGSLSLAEIKEMLKYMDTITLSLDENIHTYSNFDVLEMEKEMMSALAKLESLKLEKEKLPPLFIPGRLDQTILDDMIGHVISSDHKSQSIVDVTETHTIKSIDTYTLNPQQSGQEWIRHSVDGTVKLLDSNGKNIQQMNYTCNDFVVMINDDHVYTDTERMEVRMTSPDGNERIVCNTKPLIPTMISKTSDGKILVSMRNDGNDGDLYTITSRSRSLVQRMNITGEVVTTYEFYEDDKTRLFTVAFITAENMNGDVCAINRSSDDSGELIILNRDGRVRATYRGQDDSTGPFDPRGVTCDSKYRIIVSDNNNRSVHLLSYDGTFLRYLLSGLKEYPKAVSVYDDKLWMSIYRSSWLGDFEVKVYNYK